MPETPPITRQSIDALLEFIPVFEDPEFEFSAWEVSTDEDAPATMRATPPDGGPTQSYYHRTHPEASRFVRALYENDWVVPFDWPQWQKTGERYTESEAALQEADLDVLRKLLTTHVRKERFCEGHLSAMHRCGHLTALLRRMRELRDSVPS